MKPVETLAGATEKRAFEMAVEAIKAKHSSLTFLRTDANTAATDTQKAARAAAWAMVDVLLTVDHDNRRGEGERMTLAICEARGIKGDSLRPYLQRGRAVAAHLDAIRVVNRSKTDPLTLAKKILARVGEDAARIATVAAHDQEARSIAAGVLFMTPEVFQAALVTGSIEAATAYYEAVQLCKRRGEVVATIAKACEVLAHADADTIAKVKAMVAAI